MNYRIKSKIISSTLLGLTLSMSTMANASVIYWADWQSQTASGTEVTGDFVTNTSTIDITYNNPQGIAFLQTGSGTDFFNSTQDPSISPYTSPEVDNTPTASEMIGLRNAGNQTLEFSESVANLVFSYVSLNGNGYSFDQDFDILSVGGVDGNANGYFGAGTSYKNIIDHGNGNIEYQLLGTGEPHGSIQFRGAFDNVSWNSLSDEYWNGFTVGIQGTSAEVFDVPAPSTLAIFALAIMGLTSRRFKKG